MLEALLGADVVMPQVWQKRSHLKKKLVPTSEEQSSKEKEQSFMEKKDKKTFESMSKSVTEKEACEFLKFINHSEYNVIE